MRILFDNGTPRPLRRHLFGHEVETARQRGWETVSNGAVVKMVDFSYTTIVNHS